MDKITFFLGKFIIPTKNEYGLLSFFKNLASLKDAEYMHPDRFKGAGDGLFLNIDLEGDDLEELYRTEAYKLWYTKMQSGMDPSWYDRIYFEKYGEKKHMTQVFLHSLSERQLAFMDEAISPEEILTCWNFEVKRLTQGKNSIFELRISSPLDYFRQETVFYQISKYFTSGSALWSWNNHTHIYWSIEKHKLIEYKISHLFQNSPTEICKNVDVKNIPTFFKFHKKFPSSFIDEWDQKVYYH